MAADSAVWKPVKATGTYPIEKDRWCEITFDPVTSTALRLVIKMQPEQAAGVHEWRVMEAEDD
jgi:hypothetical protein